MAEDQHSNEAHSQPTSDLSRIEATLRTKYWKWIFSSRSELPQSLFSHLQRTFPHIPEKEWLDRADFGGVYVNGYPALIDQALPCPCRIEYYEPKFDLRDASSTYPQFSDRFILFADGDLVVAFKPPKLPTMPAKEQRHFSLKASLEKSLKATVHMPSRLDVSVQGVVVASTSSRMHPLLQHVFENRLITKEYRLLSHALPPSSTWECAAAIDRDPTHPVLRRTTSVGGQTALTKFKVLNQNASQCCIQALPYTGRTHQIRVHASHSGVPIVGDKFYGGSESEELCLASFSVAFAHPITGSYLKVELPRDLQPLWLRQQE